MKTSELVLNLPTYIALTIALVAVNPVKTSDCAEGWAERLSRCYYFSNTTTDWYTAWENCGKYRANLLSIESVAETNNVNGYIQLYTSGSNDWWTSGSNDNDNGDWVWYGTDSKIYYENVCTTQDPNPSPETNHCIALSSKCGHAWVTADCTSKDLKYICEKDADLADLSVVY